MDLSSDAMPPEPAPLRISPRAHQRWTLDDIAWEDMRAPSAAEHEVLFYMVTSASFVESATDTYTSHLSRFFAEDPAVANWLEQHWQPEELQHGLALKRYVQLAWPFFDWDQAYAAFLREFAAKCQDDGLEASYCLEAVSRCIVEMGTSSYYTAIRDMSPDPVLSRLANLIRADEVRHYKYFFRFFTAYREREGTGRMPILRAILRRLRMLDLEDSSIALKHSYVLLHPDEEFDRRRYRQVQKQIRDEVASVFPIKMSAKMTLKPLRLNHRVHDGLVRLVDFAAQRAIGSGVPR
jgi:hypothetical protein